LRLGSKTINPSLTDNFRSSVFHLRVNRVGRYSFIHCCWDSRDVASV
jgi:hypothetical protein